MGAIGTWTFPVITEKHQNVQHLKHTHIKVNINILSCPIQSIQDMKPARLLLSPPRQLVKSAIAPPFHFAALYVFMQ